MTNNINLFFKCHMNLIIITKLDLEDKFESQDESHYSIMCIHTEISK